MSTVYTGNAANVTTPLAATVSTTTGNGVSPIVVTTSANHLYATGDVVTVSGVTGNTAANVTATIIALSSTTFSLTGTTGNGAYTGPSGSCSNNSLTPQFTIPSDGDAFNAAAFNVAFQMLGDRTQALALRGIPRVDIISASGTWTAPPGVTKVVVGGVGAGGGGGGGAGGSAVTNSGAAGGGAGGAAIERIVTFTVSPGTPVNTVIGAAGTAGTAGTAPNGTGGDGGNGGDTTFNGIVVSSGAGGGRGGGVVLSAGFNTAALGGTATKFDWTGVSLGGRPIIGVSASFPDVFYAATVNRGPGAGGYGYSAFSKGNGAPSPSGQVGGTGGSIGTPTGGSHNGGGSGGGGAGGPGGAGGNGGSGGNGNDAGAGTAGSAGSAASANTGAGGGGGGAGGAGTSGGVGAAGGAGGSGSMWIFYVGPQAAIT